MHKSLKIVVLAGILIMAFSANVMALHIDFTNKALFGGVHDQQSFSTVVDTVGLSLLAEPVEEATMTWNTGDGIGIKHSYEYDEIESDEQLNLVFDNSVLLETIYLTDFFRETREKDGQPHTYNEQGSITLLGDNFVGGQMVLDIEAYSPTAGTNGEFTLDLGAGYLVDEVHFTALGKTSGEDHDYSLAGVVVNSEVSSPVPEPGTLILLGIGILGSFKAFNKRKR